MHEARLSHLTLLSIERDIAIDKKKVVESFQRMNERRIVQQDHARECVRVWHVQTCWSFWILDISCRLQWIPFSFCRIGFKLTSAGQKQNHPSSSCWMETSLVNSFILIIGNDVNHCVSLVGVITAGHTLLPHLLFDVVCRLLWLNSVGYMAAWLYCTSVFISIQSLPAR